ncbi:MAG: 50S ribosomal protein L4 [Thermodesulfobacteriota bacterium]
MATIDVYNMSREKTSQVELDEDIFNVTVKPHVLHEVVVTQLLKRRSGTAAVKGRSDVKASGTKLYRQKGTGRARAGSIASPIRRGGGVAFGPAPRKYDRKVSKKVRKAALRMALSDKFQNEKLVVLDEFDLSEIKTREFVNVMKAFDADKALIVTAELNGVLEKSARNVPRMKVLRCEGLNVYDVLNHEHLFVVEPAIEKIQEALVNR